MKISIFTTFGFTVWAAFHYHFVSAADSNAKASLVKNESESKDNNELEVVQSNRSLQSSRCGCSSCTSSIYNRNAGGHKVVDRINWLKRNKRMSEKDACNTVCRKEFPSTCRECIPDQCNGNNPSPTPPAPTPPTGSPCSGSNKLKFVNRANKSVWIYDFPFNRPNGPRFPVGNRAIAPGASVCVTMTANSPGMRIYVSNRRLSNSMEKGLAPDSGNPGVDGNVLFSFFEYFYEANRGRYTVDLSYIDEFSFPLTVKFANVGSYGGAVEGHEYGPKSLSSIRNALARQTDFSWRSLVWPNMNRIVGPLKVWQYQRGNGVSNLVPSSFGQFVRSLPKDGRQLFGSMTNWDGWNRLSRREPSRTGYVRALHSVTRPDRRGKYGYFCYPIDNVDGEFTWMPTSIKTTVTIYSDDS